MSTVALMWGRFVPISAPVLWHFCCTLEVACLHEETVWIIASIIFSLGLRWVTSERVIEGTTAHQMGWQHIFISVSPHTHTHTQFHCKQAELQSYINTVVPADVSQVWLSAPKTELSTMSRQCSTFPWTPVWLRPLLFYSKKCCVLI